VELSFRLVNDEGILNVNLKKAAEKELFSLFPGTTAIAILPPFLILCVKQLPPAPWPLTVAGAPLALVTNEAEMGFDIGVQATGASILVDEATRCDQTYMSTVADKLLESGVQLKSLSLFTGSFWQLMVAEGTEFNKLPHTIYSLPVFCQHQAVQDAAAQFSATAAVEAFAVKYPNDRTFSQYCPIDWADLGMPLRMNNAVTGELCAGTVLGHSLDVLESDGSDRRRPYVHYISAMFDASTAPVGPGQSPYGTAVTANDGALVGIFKAGSAHANSSCIYANCLAAEDVNPVWERRSASAGSASTGSAVSAGEMEAGKQPASEEWVHV
jgi:hypothetical protein